MKAHPASSPLDTVIQSSNGRFTCETACEKKTFVKISDCVRILLLIFFLPFHLVSENASLLFGQELTSIEDLSVGKVFNLLKINICLSVLI